MGMLDFVGDELARLEREGLRRTLREVQSPQGPEIVLDGRPVINFCSNDYLSLANHPLVIASAQKALQTYSVGAGSARLIAGNQEPHTKLERALVELKGASEALLFSSGYHVNTGVIPALVGKGDAIFSDELNHASIIDGCRLSRAEIQIFNHNDMNDLEHRLRITGSRRKLIVIEGLYSMGGDYAPLQQVYELARQHDALMIVDEAHAVGVVGPTGAGICEEVGLTSSHGSSDDPRLLRVGTLGKALGSMGAYVVGSGEVIEFLRNRARSFIFTTAVPALVAAAAEAAIRIVLKEPERRQKVLASAEALRGKLNAQGWDTEPSEAHIIPIMIGPADRTMELTASILEKGIYVQGIRPPTVPNGECRLRVTMCAGHTPAHLDRLVEVLGEARGHL